ncbi:hypothetical protein DFH07DRAFT_964112 [Mycena maculata]|uniref:Uncharacterized protein n=1 Tax=Mycena maculata TaxID=230809 RepID=A0AAD7N2H7_9AGAR|nr:hypothetical protein DFH07DRAFT_964112 [Mycena maculata]
MPSPPPTHLRQLRSKSPSHTGYVIQALVDDVDLRDFVFVACPTRHTHFIKLEEGDGDPHRIGSYSICCPGRCLPQYGPMLPPSVAMELLLLKDNYDKQYQGLNKVNKLLREAWDILHSLPDVSLSLPEEAADELTEIMEATREKLRDMEDAAGYIVPPDPETIENIRELMDKAKSSSSSRSSSPESSSETTAVASTKGRGKREASPIESNPAPKPKKLRRAGPAGSFDDPYDISDYPKKSCLSDHACQKHLLPFQFDQLRTESDHVPSKSSEFLSLAATSVTSPPPLVAPLSVTALLVVHHRSTKQQDSSRFKIFGRHTCNATQRDIFLRTFTTSQHGPTDRRVEIPELDYMSLWTGGLDYMSAAFLPELDFMSLWSGGLDYMSTTWLPASLLGLT